MMGTYVTLEVEKGEKLTVKEWNLFKKEFLKEYEDTTHDEYYLNASFGCFYSFADIERITKPFKKFKGKDILFKLWYDEREPDETLNLKEVRL